MEDLLIEGWNMPLGILILDDIYILGILNETKFVQLTPMHMLQITHRPQFMLVL